MAKEPICEITLTGTAGGEWQGWVYFPATGERRFFASLPEMIRAVGPDPQDQAPRWEPAGA